MLLNAKAVQQDPPSLSVVGPTAGDDWTHGFSAINAALFLNLRLPDALSPLRYARPAPAFPAIYLWDSAFIAQVWKWWDPETARDILNAVLLARMGDRLQHFVSEFGRSEFTQPPLVAWSLQKLAQVAEPEAARTLLEQAYPVLRRYHDWLFANRRLSNGLFAWAHAYESGAENAPRFGARDERKLRDTRSVAAPDLCAYIVLQCEALEAMALALGERHDAAHYAQQGADLRAAVNAVLWDDAEGFYFDRDSVTDAFVRSRTIAGLLPLWAGIPDRGRAARLVEHVLDPGGFNTLIPLPSVAISDPAFERDMWRGPVWVNTAFAVIQGLHRYGFNRAASDLAYRLCDGVYRTYAQTGRFYEFYDPTAFGVRGLSRKKGNRWKELTLGKKPVADFVGWTGLVNTLVIESLFGLHSVNGKLSIQPRFPRRAEGRSFALAIPALALSIELEVRRGEVAGRATSSGEERTFQARFGDVVSLGATFSEPRGEVV